jgi:Sigma 54 modulation/S30EA ribosomal protein C terminus
MQTEVTARGPCPRPLAEAAAEDVAALERFALEPRGAAEAAADMATLDRRFLYFTDAETGRGSVLYLRNDGHDGLIEPAT